MSAQVQQAQAPQPDFVELARCFEQSARQISRFSNIPAFHQGDVIITQLQNITQAIGDLGARVDNLGVRVDNLGARVDNLGARFDDFGARFDARESILKHEEALAEMDISIDDWIRKSEQAEYRRMRVQQKLLEHVAAALTLRPNGTVGSQIKSKDHTPPESPEQDEGFCSNERRDVQSIKIYADAGVTALLADIEREIVSMEPEKQGFR
ncbi:MAG: hypothetical protein Q9185_002420 [Variospora sp. 1 TL-2023]